MYDYEINLCLMNYEDKHGGLVGFKDGQGEEGDIFFGNLVPYVEIIPVIVIEEEPELLPPRGNYSYDGQQIQDYICDNSEMFFYQNPNANDPDSPLYEKYNTKIYLNCSVFSHKDDKFVAHYFFWQNQTQLAIDMASETNETVIPQILVNRSDANENYFQTRYKKPLEYLSIKNEMYFNTESEGQEMVKNESDFATFADSMSSQIMYFTAQQTITEEVLPPVSLHSKPLVNINIGSKCTMVVLHYKVMFEDNNFTSIKVEPHKKAEFPSRQPTQNETVLRVDLDFEFKLDTVVYTYIGYMDIAEKMGGISGMINGVIAEISIIFLILYTVDMIRIIFSRYKLNYVKLRNAQLLKNKQRYIEVIEMIGHRGTRRSGYADNFTVQEIEAIWNGIDHKSNQIEDNLELLRNWRDDYTDPEQFVVNKELEEMD